MRAIHYLCWAAIVFSFLIFKSTAQTQTSASDLPSGLSWIGGTSVGTASGDYSMGKSPAGDLFISATSGSNGNIYRSTNSGLSWTLFGTITGGSNLSLITTPNYFFVSFTLDNKVYLRRSSYSSFGATDFPVDIGSAQANYSHVATDAVDNPADFKIYIIWSREIPQGGWNVKFEAMDVNATVAIPETSIIGTQIGDTLPYKYSRIVYSRGTFSDIHVVSSDSNKIVYCKSSDLGQTWSDYYEVSLGPNPNSHPDVAADSDNVMIVWDQGIPTCKFRYSVNGGGNWSDTIWMPTGNRYPRAGITNNRWHMTTINTDNSKVYYWYSVTPPVLWYGRELVSTPEINPRRVGVKAFDDYNVAVVWTSSVSTYFDASWKLTQPSGLTASAVADTQINLMWTDNSEEDSFRIFRKTGVGGTYAQIDDVVANQTSYQDKSLLDYTQYYYKIQAEVHGTGAGFSNETNAKTPLGQPKNLRATSITRDSINIAWSDRSGSETNYLVERKVGGSGSWTQVASMPAHSTAYKDASIAANKEYRYKVRASITSPVAYSSYSDSISVLPIPKTPNLQSAQALNDSSILLSWKDSSEVEDGFVLERKQGISGIYNIIALLEQNTQSYKDTGLMELTQYFYRLRAFNSTDSSFYSNEVSAFTLLKAPSNFIVVSVSQNKFILYWDDNSNSEIGFKVERKVFGGPVWIELGTLIPANVITYIDSLNIIPSTDYCYRIRAYNGMVFSTYSDSFRVFSLPNPPVAPTSLQASATSESQINLSWVDNSNNELGFVIERKIGTGGTFDSIAVVPMNHQEYMDQGLTPQTQYCYRIRSYNGGGSSAYSNAPCAVTFATGIQEEIDIPKYFSISQNYPNPFNPVTNFEFCLPKSAFVSITIYNIAGIEVATLVSKQLNAGRYNIQWEPAGFASGVYYLRFRTAEFQDTKKLIFIR